MIPLAKLNLLNLVRCSFLKQMDCLKHSSLLHREFLTHDVFGSVYHVPNSGEMLRKHSTNLIVTLCDTMPLEFAELS